MNKTAILVINRNDYSNTDECLTSLLENNKNSDFTIVLIDNNSHDGSREKLIEKFNLHTLIPINRDCEKQDIFKKDTGFNLYQGRNVCLRLNDNYGFTGANNFGMKFAWQHNFENIMWLNNDTIVNKGLMPALEAGIKKYPNSLISPKIVFHPDIDYIWFLGGKFNWFGKPMSLYYKKNHHSIKLPKYIQSILCSGCLMFYSRDTLRILGGQDNNYFFNLDDADYSYEAHIKGISTVVDTDILLYHKSARSVVSMPGLAMYYYIRNIVYFRRKFFPSYKNLLIYLYLCIHVIGVLIIFTLKGKKPYKFVKCMIRDVITSTMGKFKGTITG